MFTTTHWSVVLRVGQEDSTQAMAALEQLCRTYWYPLYAYVRRRGCTEHDAQDLIQGFFAILLKREGLHKVVPGRAKFRSYLLTALNHFLIDEHDRQHAQKRGGGQPVVSLDAQEAEQCYRLEPHDTETPEKLFERRWAVTVTESALARLEREYRAAGKPELFEDLYDFLVASDRGRPYAEVAASVGQTEDALKKAVQRLRQRYQELVRDEIAQTVSTASEIEEELRFLRSVLSS
jgi:RNA polymerase sigma-70 factor (ECF subfamily)